MKKTRNFGLVTAALISGTLWFWPPTPPHEEETMTVVHKLMFFYDETNDEMSNYVDSYLREDVMLLNNLSEKLTLKDTFELLDSIPIILPDSVKLNAELLDDYFKENYKDFSQDVIRVYLDDIWNNHIPNSYRLKDHMPNDYIFIKRNQLGHPSILMHEIIHRKLMSVKCISNGSIVNCESLPRHHTKENLKYCTNKVLPFCSNIMTKLYSTPCNLFLTPIQINWIKTLTYNEGNLNSNVWCDSLIPRDWASSAAIDTIFDADCCVIGNFDSKDIKDVIDTLTRYRTKMVHFSSSILSSLLNCTGVDSTLSTCAELPAALTIRNLDMEIEAVKSSARKLYEAEFKINLSKYPKAELEWEKNYALAKKFLMIWFKASPNYIDRLRLECELLCEEVPDVKFKDYYRRRKAELDREIRLMKGEIKTTNKINISTGFRSKRNKFKSKGKDDQWRIIRAPQDLGYNDLPRAARIVHNVKAWNHQVKSKWISLESNANVKGSKCSAKDCSNCDPITYERCFTVPVDGLVTMKFKVMHDDFCGMSLKGPDGYRKLLHSACDDPPKGRQYYRNQWEVYESYQLKAGEYCIRASVYNWGGPTGFNLEGYVEGTPLMLPKMLGN